MVLKEFKELIKSCKLQGIYYLYGEEKFLLKTYKDLFIKSFDKYLPEFNLKTFSQENFDLQKIFDAVNMLPFMAEKKCVHISNFDIETVDQSSLKSLKEILKDIPDTTVVIITQSLFIADKKLSSKQKTFIKFIDSIGNVLEFNSLTKTELNTFLRNEAQKNHISLSRDLAYDIIDKCGTDLNTLKNELNKLCAYVGENSVTSKDIQDILVFSTETNVFELTKSIMSKNQNLAHKKLEYLFQKREEPVAILAVIAATFVDLYRVKVLIESGENPGILEKYFNYKGKTFKIEIAKRECQKFSIKSLRYDLFEIVKADYKLKSSRVSPRVILDSLICKLCT